MDKRSIRLRAILVNVMHYFVLNGNITNETQMFKQLYYLDVAHFKETGRTVTKLEYQAWGSGPIPVQQMNYWESIGMDLMETIELKSKTAHMLKPIMEKTPDMVFDGSIFTPRQLKIMVNVMNEVTLHGYTAIHDDNGAYKKTWNHGNGFAQTIPFPLTIPDDDPHREDILNLHKEHQERFCALYGR